MMQVYALKYPNQLASIPLKSLFLQIIAFYPEG